MTQSRDRFSSNDPRLLPQNLVIQAGETTAWSTAGTAPAGLPIYPVTNSTFPHLQRAFDAKARGTGYSLVILGGGYGNVITMHSTRQIAVGIGVLNRYSFDSIMNLIGHEVGHVRQRERRGNTVSGESHPHSRETEADLYSACLAGSVEPVIRALREVFSNRGETVTHPSTAARIAELERHRGSPCQPFRGTSARR